MGSSPIFESIMEKWMGGKANEKRVIWLGTALLFIANLGVILSQWRYLYGSNYKIPESVADIQSGVIPAQDGLIASQFSAHLVTAYPKLLVFCQEILGWSYGTTVLWLTVLQCLFLTLSFYFIGKKIGGSRWAGLFCSAVLYIGWLNKTCLSYSFPVHSPAFEGIFAIAIGFAVLALWLYEKHLFSMVLFGVLVAFHVTNAFIVGLVLGLDYLISIIQRKEGINSRLLGAVIALIIGLPTLLELFRVIQFNAQLRLDTEAFWALLNLRKWYHVRPWLPVGNSVATLCLSCLFVSSLCLAERTRSLSESVSTKMWLLLSVVMFLLVGNILGVEWLASPTVASSQLSRSTVFLIVFASAFLYLGLTRYSIGWVLLFLVFPEVGTSAYWMYALTFVLLVGVAFAPKGKYHPLSRVAFAGLAFFCACWGIYFFIISLVAPVSSKTQWVVLASLGLVLYTAFVSAGLSIPKRWLKRLSITLPSLRVSEKLAKASVGVAATCVGIAFLGTLSNRIEKAHASESRLQAALELGQWVKQETAPDSVLLTPPTLDCTPHCLGRETIYSSVWMGMSQYIHAATEIEKKVLKIVYDLDLKLPESVQPFEGRIDAELMRRYQAIDMAKLRKIRQAYPQLTHVVGEHSVATDTYLPSFVRLPVVYENQLYRVYGLKKDIKPKKYPLTE